MGMDYHRLSAEMKQSYLNRLEEYREETAAAKMVSKKDISKDFGKAIAKLQPKVHDVGVGLLCRTDSLFIDHGAQSAYRVQVHVSFCVWECFGSIQRPSTLQSQGHTSLPSHLQTDSRRNVSQDRGLLCG